MSAKPHIELGPWVRTKCGKVQVKTTFWPGEIPDWPRRKAKPSRRKAKPVKVTAAAADYAAGEIRWAHHLRRNKSTARMIARARRAQHKLRAMAGTDASIEGLEDEDRYTDEEIAKLGREGKAFEHKNGAYSYPIADRRDLLNAVRDFTLGEYPESERLKLKAFIKSRAILLGLEDLLPKSWLSKVPRPVPEGVSGQGPYDSAPSVGGQL